MNEIMQAVKWITETPETETQPTPQPGPEEVDKMECGEEEPGEGKDAKNVPTQPWRDTIHVRANSRRGWSGEVEKTVGGSSWGAESAPTQTDTESMTVTQPTSPKRTRN